jgi:hypothetical protein
MTNIVYYANYHLYLVLVGMYRIESTIFYHKSEKVKRFVSLACICLPVINAMYLIGSIVLICGIVSFTHSTVVVYIYIWSNM